MTETDPTDTPLLATAEVLALVDRRAELKAQVVGLEKEIKAVEEKILAAGPGDYRGSGTARALVISPAPSVQMPKGKDENKSAVGKIREIIGEEETFKKLFWFVGGYVLTKDFRTKAAVLLTPARLKNVLAILETPGKPYVK